MTQHKPFVSVSAPSLLNFKVTVPVKKSSCLLFLQHCYGKEISDLISDLETVCEILQLAARFGEETLLSLTEEKLKNAEIGTRDNDVSPLLLLIRGGGEHAQVNIPLLISIVWLGTG